MSKLKKTENIYSSAVVQALEQQYCSSCSAAVVSPCLVSSMGLGERVISRIYNGGRQALYTAAVGAMLLNNVTPAYAEDVPAGNISSGLVANAGDPLNVYGGTIDTTVNSGGYEYIFDGGSATHTTVNSGGTQGVNNGGIASNTVVLGEGSQIISGGTATAIGTTVSGGGTQTVSGGTAIGTTLTGTGLPTSAIQNVQSNALASNTTINSYGLQNVLASATASGTTINGGTQNVNGGSAFSTVIFEGTQQVTNTGRATSTTIYAGTQDIQGTGFATATVISGGTQNVSGKANATTIYTGSQVIVAGGSATATTILGGKQNISTGGVASNTTVNGGSQDVRGGTAIATTINAGSQAVFPGGLASETTIAGGTQVLLNGGVASNTTITAGIQNVSNGGSAYTTIINSGGSQFVASDGAALYTTIIGGTQTVANGGSANVVTLAAGGTQNISSGGFANAIYNNGGTVNLLSGSILSGYTGFNGNLYVYGDHSLPGGMAQFNGGQLVFAGDTPSTITVENLSANNTVVAMGVDLQNQTGDQLKITSSYYGSATLKLTNTAAGATETTSTGIKLVEFASGATTSGTFDLAGGQMDDGGYVYKLAQDKKQGDYYLRSTGKVTDIFKTMLNIPVINAVIAQTGMNSLQRRLGDLRNMSNLESTQGVWVRGYYKDMTVKDLAETDLKLFGAEAGYDWLFRAEEPTKLYAGVLVGYVNADSIKTKKNNGMYEKGDGEAPGVGIYATLVNENGWFVDLAARNFWTKLDMKNHASDGTELAYKPERNVITTSLEVGKSFESALARNRFIRIEPKVEVGYMNAEGKSAEVSNTNQNVKYDAANYINAKAAVLLSYNVIRCNGLLIEPLLELAYRYEFDGKDKVHYAGATSESDLSGGTAEINAGLNMELTRNLYWYGLGSYEASNKVKGWGVHAGIRYTFGNQD